MMRKAVAVVTVMSSLKLQVGDEVKNRVSGKVESTPPDSWSPLPMSCSDGDLVIDKDYEQKEYKGRVPLKVLIGGKRKRVRKIDSDTEEE